MTEDRLKREIATCCRLMEYVGLIDFSGHVSARIGETDTFLINPRLSSRCAIGPGDLLKVNLNEEVLDGSGQLPIEVYIHSSIYRRRPDVNAVAHLHPPATIALSAAGKRYLPVIYHAAIFAEGVPFHDDCRHINSVERGDSLAVTLGHRRALIMRGHGAVMVAESVQALFFGSACLEDNAKHLITAYQIGEPTPLREEELAERDHIWRPMVFEKIWTYYLNKSGLCL